MPLTDEDVTRIAEKVIDVLGWRDPNREGSPLRSYNNDISRIRRTLRAMARHLHLPEDHIEV